MPSAASNEAGAADPAPPGSPGAAALGPAATARAPVGSAGPVATPRASPAALRGGPAGGAALLDVAGRAAGGGAGEGALTSAAQTMGTATAATQPETAPIRDGEAAWAGRVRAVGDRPGTCIAAPPSPLAGSLPLPARRCNGLKGSVRATVAQRSRTNSHSPSSSRATSPSSV